LKISMFWGPLYTRCINLRSVCLDAGKINLVARHGWIR
jgi:hypothetical protein